MVCRKWFTFAFFAAFALLTVARLHGADVPAPVNTGNFDVLPLTMEEMDEYDRIAMEPYADRYDELPLHEKAELYAGQFQFMRGRVPRFHGVLAEEIRRSQMESGISDDDAELSEYGTYSSAPADSNDTLPSQGVFDALPQRMADMGEYERIAMEPYADRYDKLPLHEKARLYGRQFEFMRGRAPLFSPEIRAAIRRAEGDPVQENVTARRDLYKEPENRKRRSAGLDLHSLPGPWDIDKKPDTPEGVYVVNPDGSTYQERDVRMESLRGGWDSRELLRGSR